MLIVHVFYTLENTEHAINIFSCSEGIKLSRLNEVTPWQRSALRHILHTTENTTQYWHVCLSAENRKLS